MKKILLVDDSETIRQQLGRALVTAGMQVVEASDGIDGLERVAQHRDLAMVVLDVNMPRLNGLDMLERLRTDPASATLPVVVLTTEAQTATVERAKRAGAKAWLIKPVKMDVFVQVVRKLTS